MTIRIVDLNRFVAAISATVITALSGWAFAGSTATIERDPFQFASIMNGNGNARVAQLQSQTASARPEEPRSLGLLGPGVPERLSR